MVRTFPHVHSDHGVVVGRGRDLTGEHPEHATVDHSLQLSGERRERLWEYPRCDSSAETPFGIAGNLFDHPQRSVVAGSFSADNVADFDLFAEWSGHYR